MKKSLTPIAVPLESVDGAFKEGKASNVTIIGLSERKWIFQFTSENPTSGQVQLYTLRTQRGKVRVWSDPRNLFRWLNKRYGVKNGSFFLFYDEET